eukprot:3910380-Pyramimonas_sp.AAC.1
MVAGGGRSGRWALVCGGRRSGFQDAGLRVWRRVGSAGWRMGGGWGRLGKAALGGDPKGVRETGGGQTKPPPAP